MLSPTLVLALAVWLAAASPEGVTRIPGSKLRLGMTELQLMEVGAFPEYKAPDAAGATARQGDTKFFGVACKATLYFRDGALARARFEASGVSPKAQDYIEDQLRREKLLRECTRYVPGDHACDWLGDVKIHLEIRKDGIEAMVQPAPRPWETEAEAPAVAAQTASPPAPKPAAPEPKPAAPEPKPAAPEPKPAAPEPKPTPAETKPASTTSPPAAAAQTPPAPAPAPPPAPVVVPERAAEMVSTLPETLKLSLPERNSPTEWPRIVSGPKLVYPDAARRESVQGVVWVLAEVEADGSVKSATISRGIRELNDAAIAWISKARFAPCTRDGRPCRFWVRVAARFTMY
jgi:protein TonB